MLLVILLYVVVAVLFVIDALMREDNTYRVVCRIAVILSVPIIGILLYILDGRRRRLRRAELTQGCRPGLARLVHNSCGEPVTLHNSVEVLHNANATYAAIIGALQRARSSILLDYYIFVDDRLGGTVCDILERKARGGVAVCVIYDAVGSWRLNHRTIVRLRCSGVDIRPFKPMRFPWICNGIARRNHRKIAIVDSKVAFMGGINIAKRYIDGNSLGRWRDEHLRIEGDAVERLQRLFMKDWSECGGNAEPLSPRSAKHHVFECSPMQIAWSDECEARQTILDTFTAAIAEAESAIRMSTPYFIPPQGLFDALRVAVGRGVKVELMVPERGDLPLTAMVSESYLRSIEQCGVEVYRYENGFLHSKVLIVDDKVASVGSANCDYRSLCENLEVTCLAYDPRVIAELGEQFELDKRECRATTADRYRPSVARRCVESLARLLSPLL